MAERSRTVDHNSGAVQRPATSLIKTCVLFSLFMGIFHLILWVVVPADTDPLRASTTKTVSWLLNSMGIANIADTTHIKLRNANWIVTPECTAVNVYILFVSFVLAYAASIKSKLVAFIAGVPFIFAVNIVRLVVLGWITEYYPQYARSAHDFAWQAAFVLVVVVMWLVWIELVVNHEKTPAVSG